MKKFFAIFLAVTVIPTFHSYAWVGGPFDNNNESPDGDDGIYEAVATVVNGTGLYRWGVGNRATAVQFADQRDGNTSNVQFGAFAGTTNQHSWFYEGNVYYGSCFGTVNSALGVIRCIGNAADLVPNAQTSGVLGGPGGTVLTPNVTNQIQVTNADTDGNLLTFEQQTEVVQIPNTGVLCNSTFSAATSSERSPAARDFHGSGLLFVGVSTSGATTPEQDYVGFLVFGNRVTSVRNG